MKTHPRTCYHCGSPVHALQARDSNDDLVCIDCRAARASEIFRPSKEIPTFKLEHDILQLRSRIVDGVSYYLTPDLPWRRRKVLQNIRFVATVDGESKVFGSIQADDPIHYVVIPRVDTSGSGSDPVRLPAPADLLIFEAKFTCRAGCWSTPSYFISLAAAYDWLVEQYNGPYGPVSNGGE